MRSFPVKPADKMVLDLFDRLPRGNPKLDELGVSVLARLVTDVEADLFRKT